MKKCKMWTLYFKKYGLQDERTEKYFKRLIQYILKIEDYHSNEGSDSDDWEDDSSQQEDSDEYDRKDDHYGDGSDYEDYSEQEFEDNSNDEDDDSALGNTCHLWQFFKVSIKLQTSAVLWTHFGCG